MGKIFVNYRRGDDPGYTQALFQRLETEFAADNLFMDVEGHIKPGDDFVEVLRQQVAACDVLLAVIGARWLDLLASRAADTEDFVAIEIEAALGKGKRVIPVLVGAAQMPRADALPASIRALARRNAVGLRPERFAQDCQALIKSLREQLAPGAAFPAAAISSIAERRSDGFFEVGAAEFYGAADGRFTPGAGKTEWFKDHPSGPEMVVVPAGSFLMGSPSNVPETFVSAIPQTRITFPRAFAAGRYAVTRGEFRAFVFATGHKADGGATVYGGDGWKIDPKASWENSGLIQTERHPVVCVNWHDAKAYVAWLSKKTGKTYRLLTESEREYITRAGTNTAYWWGKSVHTTQANYSGDAKINWRKTTVPVDSFDPNPWGFYNVHGNVWEWCEDVWYDSLQGIPTDGSARQNGNPNLRIARGGCWGSEPRWLLSYGRGGSPPTSRSNQNGFRVARALN